MQLEYLTAVAGVECGIENRLQRSRLHSINALVRIYQVSNRGQSGFISSKDTLDS